MKTNTKTLIYANTLAYIILIIINVLSSVRPLKGKNPAQLSDQYPNLFVPAGITFSIWGLIYALLLLFIAHQLRALFEDRLYQKVEPIVQRVGWLFVLSSFFNVAWLFSWQLEQVLLSVGFIIGLLLVLIRLSLQTESGIHKINALEKWISHVPFSLYLGWISIALIANITAYLIKINWNTWLFSPEKWAEYLIVLGSAVALMMVIFKNNIIYGLTVVWALFGIFLKRHALGDSILVEYGALAEIFVLLIFIALRAKKWWSY